MAKILLEIIQLLFDMLLTTSFDNIFIYDKVIRNNFKHYKILNNLKSFVLQFFNKKHKVKIEILKILKNLFDLNSIIHSH